MNSDAKKRRSAHVGFERALAYGPSIDVVPRHVVAIYARASGPRHLWGAAFFPHVLTKEATVTAYFGGGTRPFPVPTLPAGFSWVADLHLAPRPSSSRPALWFQPFLSVVYVWMSSLEVLGRISSNELGRFLTLVYGALHIGRTRTLGAWIRTYYCSPAHICSLMPLWWAGVIGVGPHLREPRHRQHDVVEGVG